MATVKTTASGRSLIKRFFIDTLTNIPSQPPATKLTMRIAISSFYFCMGFSFASWASRIPDIKTRLQLSDAELGTILLALPLGQLVTMPVSGRLVTKYGSRTIMSFAALLYAIELTNIGWASQMWQLGLALFIFGVVGNMANISVNTQGVLAEKAYGRPIMTSFHGMWSTQFGCAGWPIDDDPQAHTRRHFFVAAFVYCCLYRKKMLSGHPRRPPGKRNFFPNRKACWCNWVS
jgi:MFS family permease